MPVRKLNLDTIPETLQQYVSPEPERVLIGRSVYEISRLTHEDLSGFEGFIFDIVNLVVDFMRKANKPLNQVGLTEIKNALIEANFLHTFTTKIMEGADQSDINSADVGQILHLVEVWLNLNFFSLPDSATDQMGRLMGYCRHIFFALADEGETSESESPPNEEPEKQPNGKIEDLISSSTAPTTGEGSTP